MAGNDCIGSCWTGWRRLGANTSTSGCNGIDLSASISLIAMSPVRSITSGSEVSSTSWFWFWSRIGYRVPTTIRFRSSWCCFHSSGEMMSSESSMESSLSSLLRAFRSRDSLSSGEERASFASRISPSRDSMPEDALS
uniref:(northern house mosquito) hypothetical protein n=1 Tax=Culex pipiens TaxID=7175 RepID=A0A8D8GJM8_CULPI